jgi:hypothetical protein
MLACIALHCIGLRLQKEVDALLAMLRYACHWELRLVLHGWMALFTVSHAHFFVPPVLRHEIARSSHLIVFRFGAASLVYLH